MVRNTDSQPGHADHYHLTSLSNASCAVLLLPGRAGVGEALWVIHLSIWGIVDKVRGHAGTRFSIFLSLKTAIFMVMTRVWTSDLGIGNITLQSSSSLSYLLTFTAFAGY